MQQKWFGTSWYSTGRASSKQELFSPISARSQLGRSSKLQAMSPRGRPHQAGASPDSSEPSKELISCGKHVKVGQEASDFGPVGWASLDQGSARGMMPWPASGGYADGFQIERAGRSCAGARSRSSVLYRARVCYTAICNICNAAQLSSSETNRACCCPDPSQSRLLFHNARGLSRRDNELSD